MHQILTLKRFSYCLAAVFAESLEARCQVENEDVVAAAPTGDAPTTSEWSTILLPTKVRLILEVLQYLCFTKDNKVFSILFSANKHDLQHISYKQINGIMCKRDVTPVL